MESLADGQEGGNSVTDVLSGKVSPSGKLTMTFPNKLMDVASSTNFPMDARANTDVRNKEDKRSSVKNVDYTDYEEDIFVGYRYFDSFDYTSDIQYHHHFLPSSMESLADGQEGGNSVTDVLSGKVSPSGKLTMTFPNKLMDVASSTNFPMDARANTDVRNKEDKRSSVKNVDYTDYEEDIFVGYRYFDSFGKQVSYPFGYGLSYTTFEYVNPSVKALSSFSGLFI